VGKLIKQWRISQGWSQLQLADELDVTQGYVSQLEAGKVPEISKVLRKLSKLTGYSLDALSPEQSE